MTTLKRSHLGKAGHHAVMAEFLRRGWNVAIPELDVGEDLFVVDDNADRVTRVRVKTTAQIARGGGKALATYGGISRNRLWSSSELPFYYVFVLREGRHWEFIVPQRAELQLRRAEAEGVDASRPNTRPGPRPKPTKPRSERETGPSRSPSPSLRPMS